ncbi:discoidin domain-containing protein [Komagataeibacter xylinus]|uniref:N-acetylglucosaminyltransferase n=1 Tax=Komagataeibacter xylinus TaxID=28448 RepID=A0A857FNE1_KOMXY|nr:discoidin domain-containing protein [Komagataeibacter xylinus]QHC35019.1 N-acetylglucosaminyltransferase [Komagataeibacter xylinus]
MPRIYDCFLFFNELDLLEIRLHELYDTVDQFVLCESAYTFTGQKKETIFFNNRERFAPFLDKIKYMCIEEFPDGISTSMRDFYQRQYLLNGIEDADDDDLIIMSDVDEILRVPAIEKALAFDGVTHYRMNIYQYFLNMLIAPDWQAPYAIRKKYIPRLAIACEEKGSSLTFARFHMPRLTREGNIPCQTIDDAGWHFTFMGGFDAVKAKLRAYAHADDYWPAMMRDDERLQQVLDIGIKIWSADELVHYVPIDETYPRFVRDNITDLTGKGLIRNIFDAHSSLQRLYMDLRRKFAFSNLGNNHKRQELGNFTGLEYLDYTSKPEVPLSYIDLPAPAGRLVSHDATATQSSRSPWSHGTTEQDDASRALTGLPNGNFSFHTESEQDPWWEVDLGRDVNIAEIRIFNRILPRLHDDAVPRRADEMQVYVSRDRHHYKCVYYHNSTEYIGGIDGRALVLPLHKETHARYVKIQIGAHGYLHLDKVYIYEK